MKEPGNNLSPFLNQRAEKSVFLLPYGSANEPVPGISHFFEHLLIAVLLERFRHHNSTVYGHTTEDYIILFGFNLSAGDVGNAIQTMDLNRIPIERYRHSLLKEIKENQFNPQEIFFRSVWEGSPYEKSPLGQYDIMETISINQLQDFQQSMCRASMVAVLFPHWLYRFPPVLPGKSHHPAPSFTFPLPCQKEKTINGKRYCLHFFKEEVESYYILEHILKMTNPGKHIQLSEKRGGSVLIMEQGTMWPTENNIGNLRNQAIASIKDEIEIIKSNFSERALNELESVYFYNQSWQERCKKIAA